MEYRIATSAKVILLVFVAACIIGGGYLFIHAFETTRHNANALKLGLGVLLLVIAVLVYLEIFQLRLTVDEHSLTETHLFSSRTILMEDIDGYRRGEKDIFHIILKDGAKSLQISRNLGDGKELIEWIEERYEDIDAREREKETEALLENEQFGITKKDRKARLENARKIDNVATIAGFIFCFWPIFYPRPFELLMIVVFLMPLAGVFITWYFKGLLKLYKKKSSPYPSLVLLMVMPVFGALLAGLRVYDLYGFPNSAWSLIIMGAIFFTVVCVGACWKAITNERRKLLICCCVFVLAAVYSYSLLIFANCHYDKSVPEVWKVQVLHKRINRGKSTTYYLKLSPWGKFRNGKEVTVSRSFFDEVNETDSVDVYLKTGRWGVPWFWVER